MENEISAPFPALIAWEYQVYCGLNGDLSEFRNPHSNFTWSFSITASGKYSHTCIRIRCTADNFFAKIPVNYDDAYYNYYYYYYYYYYSSKFTPFFNLMFQLFNILILLISI